MRLFSAIEHGVAKPLDLASAALPKDWHSYITRRILSAVSHRQQLLDLGNQCTPIHAPLLRLPPIFQRFQDLIHHQANRHNSCCIEFA